MYFMYVQLNKDMCEFENSVSELSRKVNSAGLKWKDAKYEELRQSISVTAADSKSVLQASELLRQAVLRFEEISLEGELWQK